MSRRRFAHAPKWKQTLAILCLVYAAIVWVLPVFLLSFVNILPFVHERSIPERLLFSAIGSLVLVVVLVGLNNGRLPQGTTVAGSIRAKLTHWIGVSAGLGMFTFMGAALSANVFGILAKILPSENYSARVAVQEVNYYGSRYKSVSLEYQEPLGGGVRHLVLSKRLFDYPVFRTGDVVDLRGKKTLIGVYVEEVSLAGSGLTGHSSGQPSAAAEFYR